MNITTFKIPARIYRDGDQIKLELDESKKELVGSERLSADDIQSLPGLAQKIGADNESARAILRKTLLSSEEEANNFLIMKILS